MSDTSKHFVLMPVIPFGVFRGKNPYGLDLNPFRNDLSYSNHSISTWQWWCDRHGKTFRKLEWKYGSAEFKRSGLTFAKYAAAWEVLRDNGPGTRVLVVDADTMVRWDMPDFFNTLPDTAAVGAVIEPESSQTWVEKSIEAFEQILGTYGRYPGQKVEPKTYFNSGVMLFGDASRPYLEELIGAVQKHCDEIVNLYQSADVGSDQTVANYVLRKQKMELFPLSPEYNRIHCFGKLEYDPEFTVEDKLRVMKEAFNKTPISDMFDFMKENYIWHFTSSVMYRERLMRECWIRCMHHYE
jgi:lipopolysaccharide biosynthesis glycosyltransferase